MRRTRKGGGVGGNEKEWKRGGGKKIVINPEIARSLHEAVHRHFRREEKEKKRKDEAKDMNKLKEFR